MSSTEQTIPFATMQAVNGTDGAEMDRYERGQRDMLNAILALNPAINAKLADWHEREPDPVGRLPFDVAFWVSEVAAQQGIQPIFDDAPTAA